MVLDGTKKTLIKLTCVCVGAFLAGITIGVLAGTLLQCCYWVIIIIVIFIFIINIIIIKKLTFQPEFRKVQWMGTHDQGLVVMAASENIF